MKFFKIGEEALKMAIPLLDFVSHCPLPSGEIKKLQDHLKSLEEIGEEVKKDITEEKK